MSPGIQRSFAVSYLLVFAKVIAAVETSVSSSGEAALLKPGRPYPRYPRDAYYNSRQGSLAENYELGDSSQNMMRREQMEGLAANSVDSEEARSSEDEISGLRWEVKKLQAKLAAASSASTDELKELKSQLNKTLLNMSRMSAAYGSHGYQIEALIENSAELNDFVVDASENFAEMEDRVAADEDAKEWKARKNGEKHTAEVETYKQILGDTATLIKKNNEDLLKGLHDTIRPILKDVRSAQHEAAAAMRTASAASAASAKDVGFPKEGKATVSTPTTRAIGAFAVTAIVVLGLIGLAVGAAVGFYRMRSYVALTKAPVYVVPKQECLIPGKDPQDCVIIDGVVRT